MIYDESTGHSKTTVRKRKSTGCIGYITAKDFYFSSLLNWLGYIVNA